MAKKKKRNASKKSGKGLAGKLGDGKSIISEAMKNPISYSKKK